MKKFFSNSPSVSIMGRLIVSAGLPACALFVSLPFFSTSAHAGVRQENVAGAHAIERLLVAGRGDDVPKTGTAAANVKVILDSLKGSVTFVQDINKKIEKDITAIDEDHRRKLLHKELKDALASTDTLIAEKQELLRIVSAKKPDYHAADLELNAIVKSLHEFQLIEHQIRDAITSAPENVYKSHSVAIVETFRKPIAVVHMRVLIDSTPTEQDLVKIRGLSQDMLDEMKAIQNSLLSSLRLLEKPD